MLAAAALLAGVSYLVWSGLDQALGANLIAQIVSLGVALAAGFATYVAATLALRVPEANQIGLVRRMPGGSRPAWGRRPSSADPAPNGRAIARVGELAAIQERQPQPMHSVRPARSRSSSAIRSSIREVQPLESPTSPAVGGPVAGQLVELLLDLVQGEPDPLGEDDEGDPPKRGAGIAAVTRAGPFGADQAPILVEAQGGGGDAAPLRHLADGEQVVDPNRKARSGLDLKLT